MNQSNESAGNGETKTSCGLKIRMCNFWSDAESFICELWSDPRSFNWLGAFAWGAGSAIFGWLLAGLIYQRDYRNLTGKDCCWAIGAVFFGIIVAIIVLWMSKKKDEVSASSSIDMSSDDGILSKAIAPIFFILSLATLVLTFSTYNGDWKDARQGLATGFAALIAAVGAIISVYVTYKISEENRAAQKEIEDNKRDAETIRSLNDRLHDIIPRRTSDKVKEDEREKERISSYFQLAALYKDWDLLSENSEKIEKQRVNQQKYILKILFGAAKKDSDGNFIKVRTADEDIALNSIISDIFITVNSDAGLREESISSKEGGEFIGYDLEYADLSKLNFSGKSLDNSNFSHAFLDGAKFEGASLRRAIFNGASLQGADFKKAFLPGADFAMASLEDANFETASLQRAVFTSVSSQGTGFMEASLEDANFGTASLADADFSDASLEGAYFGVASLEGADFSDASLEGANFNGAKIFGKDQDEKYVLRRLARAEKLPSDEELLGIEGFTEEFLDELKSLHELQKENR